MPSNRALHVITREIVLVMKQADYVTTVASALAKVCKEEVLHPEPRTDAALGGLVALTMPGTVVLTHCKTCHRVKTYMGCN